MEPKYKHLLDIDKHIYINQFTLINNQYTITQFLLLKKFPVNFKIVSLYFIWTCVGLDDWFIDDSSIGQVWLDQVFVHGGWGLGGGKG